MSANHIIFIPSLTNHPPNMLSRLQRTKGYFFGICLILSVIVCIFSWQLFRQSPHQPIREMDQARMRSAYHFSKSDSLNIPLTSLENYLRVMHNKTQRTIMRNLAHQRQDAVLAKNAHKAKTNTKLKENSEYLSSAESVNDRGKKQGTPLEIKLVSYLNRNTNALTATNINNSTNRTKFGKSASKNSSSSSVVVGRNFKDNANGKLQFLPSQSKGLGSTNAKHNNDSNALLVSSEKFQKSLVNLKSFKQKLNSLNVSLKPSPPAPQQQQQQNSNLLPGKFIEDIHNFHAPVQRKKALANRNNLEDALSRAAMDPPDHVLTGKLCQDCLSSGFRYDLNVEDVCHTEDVRLVILVESPPSNQESRNAIRKTWGTVSQVSSSNVRVLFLLGKSNNPLENELAEREYWLNQDIIQIDFVDAYANLTYKTLSGLHWVDTFCSNAKYVMKTDDDMYVNTPLISKMLLASPKTSFLGGYCWGVSTPHRDSSSKWYVPYEMYPSPTFPPMCSGTGYIMSQDLVKKIISVSLQIGFFYLEDVYVALCLQQFDIYPVNIQGFSNMLVPFDSCLFRNSVLSSHGHSPYDLQTEWVQVLSCYPKDLTPHQLFMPVPYPEVD